MSSAEKYIRHEDTGTVSRLDLRARFIVEGFLSGLHASPFHGFSVEFSEHRRYSRGDDPKNIDWLVFAKTDRFYVKKYEAETNITGYLLMDLSESMAFTYRQQLTKFEYCICLAAALAYLMIHQQDPIGLIAFDDQIRHSLPSRSRRTQLGQILALLSQCQPSGATAIGANLKRVAAMLRHRSLLMLFSDLLTDPDEVLEGIRLLRYAGHDVILFHVMDEAEVTFPYDGMVDMRDPETQETVVVDAHGIRADYLDALAEMRSRYQRECLRMGADFVPLDTSMPFDRALLQYLSQRKTRF